ncbi:DUF2065 family protein [Candidatus Persebacteraceae bacterium Df01]|jgi:uncharacterized protein YjeT (DUF2065 family)|uniref:DUF2065 family protein n=1 Tax=Candidatus Doriopsillibacter californiensis TaxID=2970740 RepID=A0ABT7QLM4_9GAMM|nr:DUF2065 family protein [Candidatus Persebacteraceae bacterium Df01]
MTISALLSVIGLLLLIEGVFLLFVRESSWRRFSQIITEITVGQVRTVGIIMVCCGLLLLAFF